MSSGVERARHRCSDWPRVKLHVVTGKGGTGKSTVAAALALALASHGKNVLLCEVEGRQGIARMFDVDELPYEERRIAAGLTEPDGTPGTRLRAAHRPGVGAAGVPLDVLQARPGRPRPRPVRGDRVRHHDRARRPRRAAHRQGVRGGQAGPPRQERRGSTTPSCSTRRRPAGSRSSSASTASSPDWPRWARSSRQADNVMTLFRSKRTAVHLVTVLEEMPVQETARRDRGAARRGAAGRRRGRQPGPARRTSTPTALAAARDGQARPRRARRRPQGGRRRGRRRPGRGPARRGPRPRRATRPRGRPARAGPAGSTCRRTSCRGCPAASTSARSTSWPPTLKQQGLA